MPNYAIRFVTERDAAAILAIYASYVENTVITFECTVPSLEEFTRRIRHASTLYPYLVATVDGAVCGFAYVGPFRAKEAYRFDLEDTVYLAPEYWGHGIGRALCTCLFTMLRELGYRTAYAAIALPNEASMALHYSMGFRDAGLWRKAGFKLNRWIDVALLDKPLSGYPGVPEPPRGVAELDPVFAERQFARCAAMIRR